MLDTPTDPGIAGCDGAVLVGDDGEVELVVCPWATDGQRYEQLERWALDRAQRLLQGGVDVDGGWRRNRQGKWQSWARPVTLQRIS